MNEKIPSEGTKPERISRRRLLKGGGAAAIGTLTAGPIIETFLAHKDLRAAEIEPNASWEKGIKELQRSAREDGHEVLTMFIEDKDGGTRWLSPIKGERYRVRPSFAESFELMLKANIGGQAERVCFVHTHPPLDTSQFGARGPTRLVYNPVPPSVADVAVAKRFEGDRKTLHAVIDVGGLWYYRSLKEEERDHLYEWALDERIGEFRALLESALTHLRTPIGGKPLASYDRTLATIEAGLMERRGGPPLKSGSPPSEEERIKRKGSWVFVVGFLLGYIVAFHETDNYRMLVRRYGRKIDSTLEARLQRAAATIAYMGERSLGDVQRRFLRVAVKGSVPQEEYRDLRLAYLQHNALIRHVPRGQIFREPPCAGADYVSGKR